MNHHMPSVFLLALYSITALAGEGSLLVAKLKANQPQTVVTYGTSLTSGGAWVDQVRDALTTQYPGLCTVINSAQGAMWSKWGVDNLATRVATARKLKLIDLNPRWEKLRHDHPAQFAQEVPDGIHPSATGCQNQITPVILREIGLTRAVAPPSPVRLPPAATTVALFHFDQNTGKQPLAATGHGATGVLGPEVRWTPDGKFKGALEFIERTKPLGHNSTIVNLPPGALSGDAFAIDFWFLIPNTASMDRDLYFLSNNQVFFRWASQRRCLEFNLWLPKSGTPGEWVGCSSDLRAVAPAALKSYTLEGFWYHFAGSYDGHMVRMYVDGKLLGEAPGQGVVANVQWFSLGCASFDPDPTTAPNQFLGVLDELRFSAPPPAVKK
jgi:hypothetical protein